MSYVSKFVKWGLIDETRKPRKCVVVEFGPLRETQIYKDAIGLGWVEVDAQRNPRLEAETFQGERQGNLRFMHKRFGRSIRLNMNGAIWEDEVTGKAHRIWIEQDHDPKWFKNCLDMNDYETRLEYLVKKLLYDDSFITKEELVSIEGGIEIIKRKIEENPKNIKDLKTVPPSLEQDQGYLKRVNDFGIF